MEMQMSMDSVWQCGAITVHLGEKSGKYPEGNQVLVRSAHMRVAFDTPLVANRIGADFQSLAIGQGARPVAIRAG